MRAHVTDTFLVWKEVSSPITDRLEAILESWRDTPYMAGQQCKGGGVDCVRFVCGVIDEFKNQSVEHSADLPPDASMNAPESAVAAMKAIASRYTPFDKFKGTLEVEPLDVVVVGLASCGPGHALIAGYQKNTLWQADDGITVTGIGLSSYSQKVFSIFRMRDKESYCFQPLSQS